MSVPLRSALKSPMSRPDSPSLKSPILPSPPVLPISPSTSPQLYASSSNTRTPHHQSPTYTPKVSFDTFENPVASMFSFTLQVKSEGYRRTRNTRVFLCASSPDESGREALEWSLESLVQEGDELIVFRGVDEDVLGDFYSFYSIPESSQS